MEISNMNCSEIKNLVETIKSNYFNWDSNELEAIISSLYLDKRKNVKALGERLSKYIVKQNQEINRVLSMYEFDKKFAVSGFIAGVDEVGRGPLAGPIVAAAVVLDERALENKEIILGINDSKKLLPHVRRQLAEIIKAKAVYYSICEIPNEDIDVNGIAWCNNEVLKNAVLNLKGEPSFVISDGYQIKGINIKNEFVIKGDSKSASVACASIVAKVYRDELMRKYSQIYPEYGFEKNAGYGTKEHISAIKKYGITKIDRKSVV